MTWELRFDTDIGKAINACELSTARKALSKRASTHNRKAPSVHSEPEDTTKKGVGKVLIGPFWIHFILAWLFIAHGIRFLFLTLLVNSFFGTIRSYHRYHAYRTLRLIEKVNFKRLDSD